MSGRAKNILGKRFTRLTVALLMPERSKKGYAQWLCECDCGNPVVVPTNSLSEEHTRSCGCLNRDLTGERARTHGKSRAGLSEYDAWKSMLRRCYTKTNPRYSDWGGRGISVCDRWRTSFENFLSDMGLKSDPSLTLDRINNDGNYEPSNCRWATYLEQSKNKRRNGRKKKCS